MDKIIFHSNQVMKYSSIYYYNFLTSYNVFQSMLKTEFSRNDAIIKSSSLVDLNILCLLTIIINIMMTKKVNFNTIY